MAESLEKKEAKMRKLVKKHAWHKLRKTYLNTDDETLILLAKACQSSTTDDSVNLVLTLLDESDAVKIAALETLELIASDRVTSTLQLLYSKTPKENEELCKAIIRTVKTIKEKIVEK